MSFLTGIEECQFCGGSTFEKVCEYTQPPTGETAFEWQQAYQRSYVQCQGCSHYYSQHQMDLSGLYDESYVNTVYKGLDGLKKTFDRINNLPSDQSDNTHRCNRIHQFFNEEQGLELLDVGAGLGVFPYKMKSLGWQCKATDMDPRQIEHMSVNAGIEAFQTEIPADRDLGKFDLITFNKVLEHIEEPVAVLKAAGELLKPRGKVYLELPDGEGAAGESFEREEFFIEHHHVFSFSSLALLAERAGFSNLELKRIVEPSSKYTLYAFAELK